MTRYPPRVTTGPRTRRSRRLLARLALLLGTLLFCVVLGEGVLRVAAGYQLFALRLESDGTAKDPAAALAFAPAVVDRFQDAQATARPDLDLDWLRTSPPPLLPQPPLDRPVVSQLDRTFHYYVLNEKKLRSPEIRALLGSPVLTPPAEFMVFDPPSGTRFPGYRYPASRTLPTGLVTNRFGFRGRDLEVDKGERTVRIAFVGASTTVEAPGYPHSAPELIEHWLSLWAAKKGLDVRFETINAAREAIKSPDIHAIVRDEVLPLAIDYLVYYEGANQFGPPVLDEHIAVEGEYRVGQPPPELVVGTHDGVSAPDATWLDGLADHSAIAQRFRNAMAATGEPLTEPPKPKQSITLAPELLAEPFPLARAGEVLRCGRIGKDLDRIHGLVTGRGGKLVLCTFWWLAAADMAVDPVLGAHIHVHLNRSYWPFSYANVRILADVQNRFFTAWAQDRDVDLIDVAGELPQEPALAIDAIHHNELGIRLKAWVLFARLTQLLERDLAAGVIPVPDTEPSETHPNIGPVRTIPRAEILGG